MKAKQGAIVGLTMDAPTARDYVARINTHLGLADHHLDEARKLLWELRESQGFMALGYDSWQACVMTEFNKSSATVYRQLNAALVEHEILPLGEIGQLPERVLRPLTRKGYSPAARQFLWEVANQIVGEGGRVTSGVVEQVEEGLRDMLISGHAQDGNGDQHAITEHISADLTARVREIKLAHKDHIQRMDKKRDYLAGGVRAAVTRTNEHFNTARVELFALTDIQFAAVQEAKQQGKQVYIALWTEA